MMKLDVLGKEVHAGDSVICVEPGWCNLIKAKVLNITGRGITVGYISKAHYLKMHYDEGTVQDCVVIDEPVNLSLELSED